MKKKVGKKRGNRRRQAPKDLTTAKSKKDVVGGKANFNDFNFVHKVDKASPVLFQG
jgi:type VI protein secretion system component Hcp